MDMTQGRTHWAIDYGIATSPNDTMREHNRDLRVTCGLEENLASGRCWLGGAADKPCRYNPMAVSSRSSETNLVLPAITLNGRI